MEKEFDQDLYSRQAAVYGESMGKLIKMKVFLHGLKGVGLEVAKNLILAGPASLTIQDTSSAQTRNMSYNFYLDQDSVGKSKAETVICKLKELNSYVNINIIEQSELVMDLSFYDQFDVVVFTDCFELDKLVEINNYCRSNNIGFIMGGSLGVYGYSFTDFGDNFKNVDKDGEQNKQAIISSVSQDAEGGIVTVHDDKKHGYQDGDHVTFREIEGMNELNGKVFQIQVLSPISFRIQQDTSQYNAYLREGIVEQVKVTSIIKFRSLQESLLVPIGKELPPSERDLINPDMLNFGRAEQLHLGLQGFYRFCASNNSQINQQHDKDQLQDILEKVKEINEEQKQKMDVDNKCVVDEVDESCVLNMFRFGDSQLSGVCSFFGGIVCQEIIKFTGKFMPVRQWMHCDFFKVLPDPDYCLGDQKLERNMNNDRYDDMVCIFGNEIQKKITDQRIFMIGAGALGCEYLKIFSLMGLGLKNTEKGQVMVTDDDQIEVSNLNRQFLFRKENVGQSKSMTAVNASIQMNPEFNSTGYKLRTCEDNEEFFNDDFWEGLDFVVNAVDNVKARLYTDSRCVFYHKPLFESGTLGTKCNSQVVLPKLTQSYGETNDPKEEEIPICTLKNFPHTIEHTIQWGRDLFEGIFVDGPSTVKQFVQNPVQYVSELVKTSNNKFGMIRGKLETIKELVEIMEDPENRQKGVVDFSRRLFEHVFFNQILELQTNFPQDHKTEEGQLFWSGPKRYPEIQKYSEMDQMHKLFIGACSNILLDVLFNEKNSLNIDQAAKMACQSPIKQYVPKKLKLEGNNQQQELFNDEDEEVAQKLIQEMSNKQVHIKDTFNLQEFEKDDDSNNHIDFITGCANIRARNYRINEVDRLKVKLTAGKIIPAIATTTAMVCGAVSIEILKYIQNKPIDDYKNTFMNLAVNIFIFSDPLPPTQQVDKDYDVVLMGPVKAIPPKWTVWDTIKLQDIETMQGLIDKMKEAYEINVSIIGAGKATIYNSYTNSEIQKQRLQMNMLDVYKSVAKTDFPSHKKYMELEISGDLDDGTDTLLPTIVVKVK